MKSLHVFRNETGGYAFTASEDEGLLPWELGPWTWWKEIEFDAQHPLIGASKTSPEIQKIIEQDGVYLEMSGPEISLN